MNHYKKYFVKVIREHYPKECDDIIARTDSHYDIISVDTAFAKSSANPLDKRLDFSSYFLALIKTLDEKGESFDQIRIVCIQVTTLYVQPKNGFHRFFKRLLPELINSWPGQRLVRSLHGKVSVNRNSNGFIANIVTDKKETYGFGYGVDIIECGICKLFSKHNYSKYASILCEVDKITSALAGLQLIRTGTIATGAKKCDFRFNRI